ncbi:MAG: NAD/NADP transhydrogenase beta subunit [Sediminicola sp.]|jgi:NAD/NADP transhydrogenase beta subunit|tara:strand:+ start:940 stop:1119 length:180 start_codon:yes stop_codon:yes gene_type:complete
MVMLTGGILVESTGTILTFAMCKAMKRLLFNIVFGGFGETNLSEVKERSSKMTGSITPP